MTDARMAVLRTLVSAVAIALAGDLSAEDRSDRYRPNPQLPLGDVLVSLPTSHVPAAGTWEVRFSHRFHQSIDEGSGSDRMRSFFGLDGSADIAIGLAWTPVRDLQLSLLRTDVLDDYEIAAKYNLIQQAPAIPLSVALRGGADIRTERELEDRTSFFAQAVLAHQFGRRLEVFVVPSWATNAGRTATGTTSGALFENAFNVPVGAAFEIRSGLSLIGEIVPPNSDLPDTIEADFGWAIGLKRALGGHYFEILLTNSNATHVGQYVTSTYQGNPLALGDLKIGFNIERRFGR